MALVTVGELNPGAILKLYNSRSAAAKEPVDAKQLNTNFNAYLSTINTLIQQVKLFEANAVDKTSAQTITGKKTFTQIEFSGSGSGLTTTFFTLNAGSNTDTSQSLRFNRNAGTGLEAALLYDQINTKIKALINLNLGTTARFAVANPIDTEDAVNLAYANANFVSLSTAQSITGQKTFATIPICSVSPSSPSHLVNKAYADSIGGGTQIFQQNSFPAGALDQLLVHTLNNNNLRFYRHNGASWFPVSTDIPRRSLQTISGGNFTPDVADGNTIDVVVNGAFNLLNPIFTGLTAGEYDGYVLTLRFKQGTGGAMTITGSKYRFGADITTAVLSVGAGKYDYLGLRYNFGDDKWDIVAVNKGFI